MDNKYSMKHFSLKKNNTGFTASPIQSRKNDRARLVSGFTLIELLVSSTIFLIVVILGISSLLLMNRSYKITQYKKEQFDTLNAVMEDMVRNIRVGTNIRCDEGGDYSDGGNPPTIEVPADCIEEVGNDMQASYKIALEGVDGLPDDPSDQIVYSFEEDPDGIWTLYKSTTGNENGIFVRLIPDTIHLAYENIGFSVLYSADTGDGIQPFVTIRLSGTVIYMDTPTTFNLQTSVTPRTSEF